MLLFSIFNYMNTIKVGVIGVGQFGREHILHYASMPQIEVGGVFDVDKALADTIGTEYNTRSYSSLDDLYNDESISLVSVVTPEDAHAEPFVKAVEAGKAVYVEKPLATNLTDARTMAEAAEGAIATCGYLLRFESHYAQIKLQIAEYGRLCHMYFRRHCDQQLHQIYSRTHPAQLTMTHDINITHWYAGSSFKQVIARERHFNDNRQPDQITAMIECENGVTATLEADWLGAGDAGLQHDDTCSLLLENGELNLNLPGQDFILRSNKGVQHINAPFDLDLHGQKYGPLRAALDDIVNCTLKQTKPTINTIEDAVETVATVDAVMQSALESRPITRKEIYAHH